MKFQKSNKMVAAGVAVAVLAGLGTAFALESNGSDTGAPVMAGAPGQPPMGEMPDGDSDGRHGPGGHGMDDHGMDDHGMDGMRGPVRLDVVATTLGITEAEVKAAIADGTTLAELADANGSSARELIDALVAEVRAHFDAEVASGEHTQDEADARIADATAAITEFVDNTQQAMLHGPGLDGDHMPGQSPMGGSGTGGTIDGGPADSTTTTAG